MVECVLPAKRGGLVKTVVFVGVAAGIVLGAIPARAEVCVDANARTALEMRVLQSELMVSALTCGQKSNYNAFVTTFKPFLKKQGGQLPSFFIKVYGPKTGPEKLNRIVTRLANMASQNSLISSTDAYCSAASTRFSAVLNGTRQELARMARANPSAEAHGYKACVEVAGRDVAESGATASSEPSSPQGVN